MAKKRMLMISCLLLFIIIISLMIFADDCDPEHIGDWSSDCYASADWSTIPASSYGDLDWSKVPADAYGSIDWTQVSTGDYDDLDWGHVPQGQIPANNIDDIPVDKIDVTQITDPNARSMITAEQWDHGDPSNLVKCEDLSQYPNAQDALTARYRGVNIDVTHGSVTFTEDGKLKNGPVVCPFPLDQLGGYSISTLEEGSDKAFTITREGAPEPGSLSEMFSDLASNVGDWVNDYPEIPRAPDKLDLGVPRGDQVRFDRPGASFSINADGTLNLGEGATYCFVVCAAGSFVSNLDRPGGLRINPNFDNSRHFAPDKETVWYVQDMPVEGSDVTRDEIHLVGFDSNLDDLRFGSTSPIGNLRIARWDNPDGSWEQESEWFLNHDGVSYMLTNGDEDDYSVSVANNRDDIPDGPTGVGDPGDAHIGMSGAGPSAADLAATTDVNRDFNDKAPRVIAYRQGLFGSSYATISINFDDGTVSHYYLVGGTGRDEGDTHYYFVSNDCNRWGLCTSGWSGSNGVNPTKVMTVRPNDAGGYDVELIDLDN